MVTQQSKGECGMNGGQDDGHSETDKKRSSLKEKSPDKCRARKQLRNDE
jgi:hypothetical protein